MGRLAKTPQGASLAGTITAAVAAIAIFIFGAPPWVLIAAVLFGATAYAELGFWVDRRLGRR
jgi:hypothetical protein